MTVDIEQGAELMVTEMDAAGPRFVRGDRFRPVRLRAAVGWRSETAGLNLAAPTPEPDNAPAGEALGESTQRGWMRCG
jgi:hypothetical protein